MNATVEDAILIRTQDDLAETQSTLKAAVAVLELALRYISHPDVQAIPFALPASCVQERIEEVLAAAKGGA